MEYSERQTNLHSGASAPPGRPPVKQMKQRHFPTPQRTQSAHAGVSAANMRYDTVDALRGIAMMWMTVYHFCFDLHYFGFWSQNFRADPFWTVQRTAIVSLFLLCAGLGQAIALNQGQSWQRFSRRWARVILCAALVTTVSVVMFPRSFIYFGVLHGMAVMLLIVRCTAHWGRWLWLAGAVALCLPWVASSSLSGPFADSAPWFNGRSVNWLGLVSRKPFTEDYVPVFPWIGIMWWGVAAGQWALAHRPDWLQWSVTKPLTPVAALGRWSLSYYMVHQPVMMGMLMAVVWVRSNL